MAGKLSGKTAIITGGANGIGRVISERLSSDGARVAVADIADASDVTDSIRRNDGQAISIKCDQTSATDVEALRETVDRELGGCDILVHCGGIYPPTLFEDMSFEEWRRVISVNLDSVFHLAKAVLPSMKSKGWGRIVSISSTTFHSGISHNSHYTASKAGLIGFSRGLASEVGQYGITVNTVAPGLVRTKTTESGIHAQWFDVLAQQQAIKRTEVPEDLAGPIAFLVSDDAAFITGQTILVDGGWRFV